MSSSPPKKLFWFTLATLLLVAIVFPIAYKKELPRAIKIDAKNQPTIGYPKAAVHVIVFEEPKCIECKQFSNEVFPEIKKNYIDTNKIRYTLIPVSFLPNSLPAAIALLSVYYSDPQFPDDELYFKYFEYLYAHQPSETSDWASVETLVKMAQKTSPAINTDEIAHNIANLRFRRQIERNTVYAQEIMGGMIVTPTVYVNGIKADELSFEGLSNLIDEVLERNGG